MMFNICTTSITYDLETLPNFFSCAAEDNNSGKRWYFEVSDWVDDCDAFIEWLDSLIASECEMVGYNSVGFDYPIIHQLYKLESFSAADAYQKCVDIITGDRFANMVWESDYIVPQIDLYKVHHFDNVAKATSLKELEFNNRAEELEVMPVEAGKPVNEDQAVMLRKYNFTDVKETKRFFWLSQSEIKLRRDIGKGMNISDVKMGEKILVDEMAKRGLYCFTKVNGRKVKRQTIRESVNLGECIFDYVKFERPEFERIRSYLAGKTITETKGVFDDLTATVEGIKYKIGTGGLHGSVSNKVIRSSPRDEILEKKILTKEFIETNMVLPDDKDKYDVDFARRYLCKLKKS